MNTKNLIRWAGLAAMAAGSMFVVIQPLHPSDVLPSVTTTRWAVIHFLSMAMCLLFLLGITGLYARQAKAAGWLGLAGFLVFSLAWAVLMPFGFAEALILPLLATESPRFVESFLGMFNGHPGAMNLGALAAVWNVAGLLYMLGGLLFGIATFRSGILPRWAGGLLAVAAAVTPAGALVPHEYQRILAVPVGLAMAWLGYELWADRGADAVAPVPGRGIPQFGQTGAD